MPPKKKAPVNAFFLFAMDWKTKQKRPMSQQEAVTEAGEIWKNMSEQAKGPWKEKAKREKMQSRNPNEKYTSTGIPLSQIEREEREKDQKIRMMKKDVETIVKRGFSDNTFAEQKYFFIHANYFAKTVEGNIYVPAEIALSCYNLKDGLLSSFHSFINPGSTIFGHAYEAREHAAKTHQLPLPPNALGEREYEKIYEQILNFLKPDEASNEYPPVYTHDEYIPVVLSILEFMGYEPDTGIIKIYSIEYLFYQLGVRAADLSEGKVPENYHVMAAVFERDLYEHRSGIACEYHESVDASKFCSLSAVIRWGYTFSDTFCDDLAITMVPGRHIPADADLTVVEKFEAKPYFNDTDSLISNRTIASSSLQSNLTELKFEREDASTISTTSTSQYNRDDFPALGDTKGLKKSKTDNYSSANDGSDEDSKVDNPWAIRAKLNPRLPNEESFNFRSIVSGRGRGIAAATISSDITSVKSLGRGSGRGRFFHQE